MGRLQAKIEAALAAHCSEPIQLCDYGTEAIAHIAIAVTASSIVVAPIQVTTGLFGTTFAPLGPAEVLPRDSVILEVRGMRELGRGRRAVLVELVRRDGSARVVELYDNPCEWAAWQR